VAAALLVGISKTGIPGVGILVVSLLGAAFGGRPSVGIMLPMLIFADVFAVSWYRRNAHWDKLLMLFPWVAAGMVVGFVFMWKTGESTGTRDILGVVIGILVLLMMAVHLLQRYVGEKITPRSRLGVAWTGSVAGFVTMVSNAAGPIMTLYLAAFRLNKKDFVGTFAWYFFILNLIKIPLYYVLNNLSPQKPLVTVDSLLTDVVLFPGVLVGVYIGRWLLPRISQKAFETVVLLFAGIAAVKLILG